jgi:hypothetical protein
VDTEYDRCNFTQHVPDTSGANPTGVKLFPGYSGPPITFRNSNLVNCEPPPGSIVINCNTTIKEFNLFDREETITVDGVEVHRRRFNKMRNHGRWNPDTGSYDYITPYEVEQ